MLKRPIVIALMLAAVTVQAMATDFPCPSEVLTRLDGRGLQRHNRFDETHPSYNLPTDLDGGGSLQVLCVGNVDLIIGVNTGKPSEPIYEIPGRDCA